MRISKAVEKLISEIRVGTDYFPRNDDYWEYYRDLVGWIGDDYLHVDFTSVNGECEINISSTTDCLDKVLEILSEWSDLITEE